MIVGKATQVPVETSYAFRHNPEVKQLYIQLESWERRIKDCKSRWELRSLPFSPFGYEAEMPSVTGAEALEAMTEKVRLAPEKAQWRARYIDDEIIFSIVVSNAAFEHARRQFEVLLGSSILPPSMPVKWAGGQFNVLPGSSGLRYSLKLEFNGFSTKPTSDGNPTFEQFFAGVPLSVGGNVEVAIYAPAQNDA